MAMAEDKNVRNHQREQVLHESLTHDSAMPQHTPRHDPSNDTQDKRSSKGSSDLEADLLHETDPNIVSALNP